MTIQFVALLCVILLYQDLRKFTPVPVLYLDKIVCPALWTLSQEYKRLKKYLKCSNQLKFEHFKVFKK